MVVALLGCHEVVLEEGATVAACEDDDRDGYGPGCWRGPDCNDQYSSRHPGAPEACNTEDDDCDGRVDEGLGAGALCMLACGRTGQLLCSADETRLVCRSTLPEVGCNGQDDDCDGLVDEVEVDDTHCDTGLPGPCADGYLSCRNGMLECINRVAPETVEERCNLRDDDCDGAVDEGPQGGNVTRECYYAAEETEGVGRCRPGTMTCHEGRLGPCTGLIAPQREACNLADDDCDGRVDEVGDCRCEAGTLRVCGAGEPAGVGTCTAGVQTCTPEGFWGTCEGSVAPALEFCSGLDEDCDGAVDESTGVENPGCSVGVGGCRRGGILTCVEGELRCKGEAGAPQIELCDDDLEDEDCDGQVDEGCP